MLRNTPDSWGALAKLLHWAMAFLIFVQFALGWVAVSWKLSPTKLNLFVWHKSIGILLLALLVLRLIWRLTNPTPKLPDTMPQGERIAARASHALLYAIMIAMPVSGWIINSAANIPFRIFWWLPLPAIVAPDKTLAAVAKTIHFSLFIALALVIIVHVAAAVRHHAIKRNDLLRRMLPGKE